MARKPINTYQAHVEETVPERVTLYNEPVEMVVANSRQDLLVYPPKQTEPVYGYIPGRKRPVIGARKSWKFCGKVVTRWNMERFNAYLLKRYAAKFGETASHRATHLSPDGKKLFYTGYGMPTIAWWGTIAASTGLQVLDRTNSMVISKQEEWYWEEVDDAIVKKCVDKILRIAQKDWVCKSAFWGRP